MVQVTQKRNRQYKSKYILYFFILNKIIHTIWGTQWCNHTSPYVTLSCSNILQTDDQKPDDNSEKIENNPNCPLDRDELGRNTWGFLHTMAAYYPEKPSEKQQKEARDFFTLFSHFYPCEICAQDLQKQ